MFRRDPVHRKRSGVRGCQILRAQDDPCRIMIDLEFDFPAKSEALPCTISRIGDGPGTAVLQSPHASVADRVEVGGV